MAMIMKNMCCIGSMWKMAGEFILDEYVKISVRNLVLQNMNFSYIS